MKKILFLSLILVLGKISVGQISIGFTIGENFSKLIQTGEYKDSPLIIQPDQQENTITNGLNFGIPIEIKISEKISLYTVPAYIEKGTKVEATFIYDNLIQKYNGIEKLNYLEFPILGKFYYLKKKISGYITFGPSFGYAINQRFKYDMSLSSIDYVTVYNDSYDETIKSKDLNEAGFDRFDISLSFGLGTEYNIWIGKMFFNLNYNHGLNDIIYTKTEETKDVCLYNRGLTTTIGYLIPLSK